MVWEKLELVPRWLERVGAPLDPPLRSGGRPAAPYATLDWLSPEVEDDATGGVALGGPGHAIRSGEAGGRARHESPPKKNERWRHWKVSDVAPVGLLEEMQT